MTHCHRAQMLEDTRFPGVAAVWHQAEMLSAASPRTPLCARWLLLSLFHPVSNTVSENLSSFFHQLLILILRKNHQAHTIGLFFFSFYPPLAPRRSLPSHPLVSLCAVSPSDLHLLTKKKGGGASGVFRQREEMCSSSIDEFHLRGDH